MGDIADMIIDDLHKTCAFCGKGKLIWKSTDKGWRLADVNGKVHVCSVRPAPEHREKSTKTTDRIAKAKKFVKNRNR